MDKVKHIVLTGKNADNFKKAIEDSKNNTFDYKKVQEESLDKLKELGKLLNKEDDYVEGKRDED